MSIRSILSHFKGRELEYNIPMLCITFDTQLTMLYIPLLIFQHSPYSVTQDCNKLMQGLFSQTLSVGNPLIEQKTASSSSTHQQSSEAVDYREMTGCEEQLSAQAAPHKPAVTTG